MWRWPFWRQARRGESVAALSRLTIVLYSRPGCHLCDDAAALLVDRQRLHGFTLTHVNVDTQPELASRYGACVPVVTMDGAVRFRGRVDARLLDRLLTGEAGRPRDTQPGGGGGG